MKIYIALIYVIASLLLLLIGRYFYKAKDTENSILFLTGDYSGLDSKRICRDMGKRIMIGIFPFIIGLLIDIFNPELSMVIAFSLFTILLLIHIIDMSLNMRKRYKM